MTLKHLYLVFLAVFLCLSGSVSAQDINLELQMPGRMFSPGMPFKLDLHIQNNGPDYNVCRLFVALNLGSDDFWFYPSWCHYPDEIDWSTVLIWASDDFVESIIPEFRWPDGVGEFDGALFLACIATSNELISNVSQITFGWTENTPTPTPTLTPTPTPVPSDFVYIPGGTFQMGSSDDEMCRNSDEGPFHTVTITRNFYMQATEVTQRQWVDIFGDNPSYHKNCLDCPVEEVTWYDCCIYCNRLSVAEGLTPCYYSSLAYSAMFDGTPPVKSSFVYWKRDANGYRLPTEAEWEYACRAGTTTAYYSGWDNTDCEEDPNLDSLGWYYYNAGMGDDRETHPVGLKQPNAWGLYDMYGNVWEWCWDLYKDYYYEISPDEDPTGPSSGWEHVKRGGAYCYDAGYCRSAYRGHDFPEYCRNHHGFRPVRSAGSIYTPTPTPRPDTPTPTLPPASI